MYLRVDMWGTVVPCDSLHDEQRTPNEGCAHMHVIPGEARGISDKAKDCMQNGFPCAGHPVVILSTSCELVHLYFFYFITE